MSDSGLREWLMLAHDFAKYGQDMAIDNGLWLMSEKLDGIRCLWDGGVSRGSLVGNVPWANTLKDKPGKEIRATGLWTRYGKVIWAPDYWVDQLPRGVLLDGELWMGTRSFEKVSSVVRTQSGATDVAWGNVEYWVFDMPNIGALFTTGRINNGVHDKRTIDLRACSQWYFDQVGTKIEIYDISYREKLAEIKRIALGHTTIRAIQQIELGRNALVQIDEFVTKVTLAGGEGAILRYSGQDWKPKRMRTMLKVKKFLEGTGRVVGWTPGKGKYLGMIGALIIDMEDGKRFELSGMTDQERELDNDGRPKCFEVGQPIRYKYRELTAAGVPKEARYWR